MKKMKPNKYLVVMTGDFSPAMDFLKYTLEKIVMEPPRLVTKKGNTEVFLFKTSGVDFVMFRSSRNIAKSVEIYEKIVENVEAQKYDELQTFYFSACSPDPFSRELLKLMMKYLSSPITRHAVVVSLKPVLERDAFEEMVHGLDLRSIGLFPQEKHQETVKKVFGAIKQNASEKFGEMFDV